MMKPQRMTYQEILDLIEELNEVRGQTASLVVDLQGEMVFVVVRDSKDRLGAVVPFSATDDGVFIEEREVPERIVRAMGWTIAGSFFA